MGTVRVSTAYEFFQAVKEHLILEPKAYMNRAKPVFEATDYLLWYYASDDTEAVGKNCDFVLNRKEMWNPTLLKGSSSKHDFIGMASKKIMMRSLPCPCEFCATDRFELCINSSIVSNFTESSMSISLVEAPEYLELPIAMNKKYTRDFLRSFIQSHGMRVGGSMTKAKMIELIHLHLQDFLVVDTATTDDNDDM